MVQPIPKAVIYFIRHGQTDDNSKGVMQGQLDTPLNSTGEEQASALGRAIKNVQFAQVFTSDLQRASKTAQLMIESQGQSSTELIYKTELRERYMSNHQGLKWNEPLPPLAKDAETHEQMVVGRGMKFWRDTILPLKESGNGCNYAVVSHGGFMKALLSHLVSQNHVALATPDIRIGIIPNTSITLINLYSSVSGPQDTLTQFAGVDHLLDGGASGWVGGVDLSGGEGMSDAKSQIKQV